MAYPWGVLVLPLLGSHRLRQSSLSWGDRPSFRVLLRVLLRVPLARCFLFKFFSVAGDGLFAIPLRGEFVNENTDKPLRASNVIGYFPVALLRPLFIIENGRDDFALVGASQSNPMSGVGPCCMPERITSGSLAHISFYSRALEYLVCLVAMETVCKPQLLAIVKNDHFRKIIPRLNAFRVVGDSVLVERNARLYL